MREVQWALAVAQVWESSYKIGREVDEGNRDPSSLDLLSRRRPCVDSTFLRSQVGLSRRFVSVRAQVGV